MTSNDSGNENPSPNPNHTGTALNNIYGLLAEFAGFIIERDRDERRWKIVKRVAMIVVALGMATVWVTLYAPILGWSSSPHTPVLSVVHISGPIGGSGSGSASALTPAIEKACRSRQTQAVLLRINSPGGSPTDAERIRESLRACRSSNPDVESKKVIALIEGVGASAAYLIAVESDEIWASRYSIVGSIGAVMRTFDAEQALNRLGVKERVFASGELKAGNGTWTPNTPEQDALSQSMVDGIATMFVANVKERRGAKLKPTADMFSGRVWLGQEAVELGLIDGTTTFEVLKQARFPDLPVHEYRPEKSFHDRLGLSMLMREFGAGAAAELRQARWE